MRCPIDETTLVMSERNGIEIDYCPQCRGVWLDRGELDKIIDRAGAGQSAPQAFPQQQAPFPQQGYGQQPYRKKRENWLSELFD
jgi:Zn-finger nucleic acid-binding protein